MSKRKLREFGFEQLEGRRLLAADFGMQVTQMPTLPAEVCMAVEVVEQVEADGDEMFADPIGAAENTEVEDEVADSHMEVDDAVESESELEAESEATEVTEPKFDHEIDLEVDPESEVDVESELAQAAANELRDPVTGTSGYFGVINAETPTKTVSFSPSQSGIVDVVTASSFGDSETRIEISNSNGDLVAASMTEDLEGFQKLTFEVEEDESYQLEISSDETGEGYFMVTVDFTEAADPAPEEPVDLHSDDIGELATELTVENGAFTIASELETEDDRDAFRFVAPTDGEAVLGMKATSENHQSDAVVSVFDSEGELIVEGSTNEEVLIRFDTVEGVEYHILVDSANDMKSEFELTGSLFPESMNEEAGELESDVQGDSDSDLTDVLVDEKEVCEASAEFDDAVIEDEVVDELFEELGGEVAVEIGSENGLSGHRHGLWFGWF